MWHISGPLAIFMTTNVVAINFSIHNCQILDQFLIMIEIDCLSNAEIAIWGQYFQNSFSVNNRASSVIDRARNFIFIH